MSCNFLMLFDATSPPRNLRREGQGRSHQDHQHSANWRCFAHHQEGRMIEVRFVSECFICFDSYTSFCSRLESELSFGLGLGEGCQVHCVGISPWPTWWKRRGSFAGTGAGRFQKFRNIPEVEKFSMAPVAKILEEPNPCDWTVGIYEFDIIPSISVHDIPLHAIHRMHMVHTMTITY